MTKEELNLRIENTVNWAESCLNSTEYCTKCLGFVEDSLERSNGIEIFGGDTAKESADLYQESMKKGIPEKGAFVFYDCTCIINGVKKNWGHVGLACENGKVIHAWDKVRIDDYLDIEKLIPPPEATYPRLIGWVPIERVLVGFIPRVW